MTTACADAGPTVKNHSVGIDTYDLAPFVVFSRSGVGRSRLGRPRPTRFGTVLPPCRATRRST
jgi:hypothetical protein